MEKILNIPSMSMFNNNWELLLKFIENEGNPPFHFEGNLDLSETDIDSLGTLVSVGGNLDLVDNIEIKSLGNLRTVGGGLDVRDTKSLYTLGNLERVGGSLYIGYTDIHSIGNLNYVDKDIYINNAPYLDVDYIEERVNIGGRIKHNYGLGDD